MDRYCLPTASPGGGGGTPYEGTPLSMSQMGMAQPRTRRSMRMASPDDTEAGWGEAMRLLHRPSPATTTAAALASQRGGGGGTSGSSGAGGGAWPERSEVTHMMTSPLEYSGPPSGHRPELSRREEEMEVVEELGKRLDGSTVVLESPTAAIKECLATVGRASAQSDGGTIHLFSSDPGTAAAAGMSQHRAASDKAPPQDGARQGLQGSQSILRTEMLSAMQERAAFERHGGI